MPICLPYSFQECYSSSKNSTAASFSSLQDGQTNCGYYVWQIPPATTTRLGMTASSIVQTIPSESKIVSTTCVDIISEQLRNMGFSLASSQAILGIYQMSTLLVFNVRWSCFHRWCLKRKKAPETILVIQVLYLEISLKLKGSTITFHLFVTAIV